MTKYQNYKHYKLPITINPLEYGKLIVQLQDLFIIQINKTKLVLLKENKEFNHIKLFREGDFIFEYKDHKQGENVFIRAINDIRFTFENSQLITSERVIRNLFRQ
jgi:hypothetical protein